VTLSAGAYSDLINMVGFVSFTLSGANTQAADDSYSVSHQEYAAWNGEYISGSFLLTGLTPGPTTVKLKYRILSAQTAFHFVNRRVGAVAL
jgi:hypothetical protein